MEQEGNAGNPSKVKPAKGVFLISEPFLHDQHFHRSVVFLVEHNEHGTVGFVLNQPLGVYLSDVLKGFPYANPRLFGGGPCETNTLHYLHTSGDLLQGALHIAGGIYWGGDPGSLKEGLETKVLDPASFRFFGGYSGWGPGQLDGEIKEGAWIVSDADPGMVFSITPDRLWKELLKKLGPPFALLADAPADPSLN